MPPLTGLFILRVTFYNYAAPTALSIRVSSVFNLWPENLARRAHPR
jgi:hypothetical protein